MFEPPRLSQLLLVVKKNGKSFRKLVKDDYETISVNLSLMSKLWPPGPNNGKIFEFFAIVKHRFGKPPLSRELLCIIDWANPKTAFEGELNSPSQLCRQI